MKNFVSKFPYFLIPVFGLTFSSCAKEEPVPVDLTAFDLQVYDSESAIISDKISQWHITNKKILVIFGYDFNKPEIVKEIKTSLGNRFGLSEDGGLISTIIYPDDFKHPQRGYVTELTSYLATEDELSGVIILGAPENTHIALARHQDFWNQNVPYPVITFFPQDEILGLEATCDLVIDKGQAAEITGEIVQDEVESEFFTESVQIISNAIHYVSLLDGALEANNSLKGHVSQMMKNKKLHHFTDPETGLQSVNHFVLD